MSSNAIGLQDSGTTDFQNENFIFNCPSWASKPPAQCGLYFDVVKENSVIGKLLIDDKPYYLIGRNVKVCDFVMSHASVSRVHASVIYHKHLQRLFLIDLGSTHGTFIGSIRLESQKPQVLPIDTTIYFGQSTRCYTLRERINNVSKSEIPNTEDFVKQFQDDSYFDDLTQYNTALNRQPAIVSTVTIPNRLSKCGSKRISFSSHIDEIINLEDVDPSVGRFRNMVQSAFIPSCKRFCDSIDVLQSTDENVSHLCKKNQLNSINPLNQISIDFYSKINDVLPPKEHPIIMSNSICTAPKVNDPSVSNPLQYIILDEKNVNQYSLDNVPTNTFDGLYKKKYAKEAWPGKKSSSADKSNNFFI